MRRALVLMLALPLAGCFETTRPDPQPVVAQITGPKFAATRFNCGGEPVEPNPDTVGNKASSAGAHYEDDLKMWGRRCANSMQSIYNELYAAGQVVGAEGQRR